MPNDGDPPRLRPRLYSLQVFRGIAALMVLLYHVTVTTAERFDHAFLGGVFSFGYTGVDFFFVLSGFIILYVHYRDLGLVGRIRSYLTKRIVRVYPIYWLVTAAKLGVLVVMPAIAKPYETDVMVIAKSIMLLPQRNLPIIGAAWTLSFEMLFYMLFGLGILFGARWVVIGASAWAVAIAAYHGGGWLGAWTMSNSLTLNLLLAERNFEFLFGCLAVVIALRWQTARPIAARAIAAVGIALFVASGWYVNRGGEVPSYSLLFGVPSFLVVVGSTLREIRMPIRLPAFLVFVGDASYSVYLTHAMFVNIALLAVGRLALIERVGPSVTTLLMAVVAAVGGLVTYRVVERPLLQLARNRFMSPGHRVRIPAS